MSANFNLQKGIAHFAAILLSLSFIPVDNLVPDGNNLAKEIFLILTAGVLCAVSILVYGNKFQISRLDGLIILFLFALPVLSFFTVNSLPHNIFISISYLLLYVSMRLMICSINSPKFIASIFVRYLTLGLIIQYIIFWQQKLKIEPIIGYFFNSGPFSIYIASISVFCIGYIIVSTRVHNWLCILIPIIYTAFFFSVVYETLSRSSLMGFAAGLIIIVLDRVTYNRTIATKKIVITSFLSVFLFAIMLYVLATAFKTNSAQGRMLIYRVSLDIYKSNPVNGVGMGNFGTKYIEHQAKILSIKNKEIEALTFYAGEVNTSFNDLLHILIERGLASTFIILIVVYIVTLIAYKTRNDRQTGILTVPAYAAICAILVSGITSYPLTIAPIAALFWTFISILSGFSNSSSKKKSLNRYLFMVFIILSFLSLYYGGSYVYSIQTWKKIIKGSAQESTLPSLFEQLKYNPNYLCNTGDYYYNTKKYHEAIKYYRLASELSSSKEIRYSLGESYEKIGWTKAAEKEYLFVERSIPHLIKPKYLLAKLYYLSGQYSKFREKLQIVRTSVAKVNSLEVEIMRKQLEDFEYRLELNKKNIVY
jgi:hypothetical protein